MTKQTLKTITKADNVTIIFGEWFDNSAGNTYFDATVFVGHQVIDVAYQYGYNAGSKSTIDDVLKDAGFRVRTNKGNVHAPYRHIRIVKVKKLKRELFK